MRVLTKVTIDIETGIVLDSQGYDYDGPVAECRSKQTQTESTSIANSAADRATRDATVSNDVQPTLDYYKGDPSQSGLYKSLMTTGTEATNRSYDDAKAATALHSNMAGFGMSSGVGQGANKEIEAERASDMARVPRESLDAAVQPNLQAAQIGANVASTYSGSATSAMSTAEQAEQARLARRTALMQSLITAGSKAASGGAMGGG